MYKNIFSNQPSSTFTFDTRKKTKYNSACEAKYTLKASETFFCYDSLSLQECFLIEFVFILKNKMFSNIKGLSSFPDNWEMWKVTSMNKTIFEISSSRTSFCLYHYSTKVIQNYFVSYWKMIHFILTHFITALINFDMKDIQR